MVELDFASFLMLFVFILGYLAIIFEYYIKVNKTASAIIMAVFSWGILLTSNRIDFLTESMIDEHLGHASQIIFFLLGAVTLVELIDSHKGFNIITNCIHTHSRRKLLWIVGFLAFFLSALLDNLTTTIILVSVIRKIIPKAKNRMVFGAAVVVAANAGGAWTPIGDVTTTMLWIKGQVTTLAVMKSLFLPSLCALVVSLLVLSINLKGNFEYFEKQREKGEPGSGIVFFIGILSLACVPIIRGFTGLPPFMSILIGLGILWVITDIMHWKHESRKHLRVPYVLTRINAAAVLFFLGILLCISSLEIVGILENLAFMLDKYMKNTAIIATSLGLISSVVDNVPLVAACTGMYALEVYPTDSSFWLMVAYAAGTGGSILAIGSAAGVALMGLEKMDFIWYFKKISFAALIGYLAGMGLYLIL
jgi:Na+/H+ antiporter NhaD/arsenite permease-like protein